jgi:Protein of unknown function (DUF3631)
MAPGLDEAPWRDLKGKPLDKRSLARRLRQYGIKPTTIRIGDAMRRGYERKDFLDVWLRYICPSIPPASATSATNATNEEPRGADVLKFPRDAEEAPPPLSPRQPCAQCNLDGRQAGVTAKQLSVAAWRMHPLLENHSPIMTHVGASEQSWRCSQARSFGFSATVAAALFEQPPGPNIPACCPVSAACVRRGRRHSSVPRISPCAPSPDRRARPP